LDSRAHVARVEALFRAHNRDLIAFLCSKLGSAAEAHELAQEAYVRLLRLEHPEQVGFLRSYLFRIAGNLAIDHRRAHAARSQAPTEDVFTEWLETPAPDRGAFAVDRLRAIRAALRELPMTTNRAFVLYMIEGRDLDAIAKHMGLAVRTVRHHVARALAHCRARVESNEGSS
jgi:RNA polymerase sigma-70 factor (ECF subfamily)